MRLVIVDQDNKRDRERLHHLSNDVFNFTDCQLMISKDIVDKDRLIK